MLKTNCVQLYIKKELQQTELLSAREKQGEGTRKKIEFQIFFLLNIRDFANSYYQNFQFRSNFHPIYSCIMCGCLHTTNLNPVNGFTLIDIQKSLPLTCRPFQYLKAEKSDFKPKIPNSYIMGVCLQRLEHCDPLLLPCHR